MTNNPTSPIAASKSSMVGSDFALVTRFVISERLREAVPEGCKGPEFLRRFAGNACRRFDLIR